MAASYEGIRLRASRSNVICAAGAVCCGDGTSRAADGDRNMESRKLLARPRRVRIVDLAAFKGETGVGGSKVMVGSPKGIKFGVGWEMSDGNSAVITGGVGKPLLMEAMLGLLSCNVCSRV